MKKVFLLSFFVLAFFKFITISVSAQNCQDCGTVNGCKITCCVSSGYDACTASGRTCQNECDPVGCSIPEDCPNKSVAEQCNPLKACSVGKQCNGGQCEYFCVGEAPCAPGGGPTSTPVPPTGGGPTNTPPPPTSTPGPSITPSPIPTITGVCVAPPDPTPRDPPPPDCSAWGGGDTRLRVTNGSSGNEFRFFVSTGNECDPALQVANSGWIANKSYFTNLSTGLYSWDARARCTSDAGNAASGLSACSVFRVDKSPPDVPSLTGSAFCSPSRVTFSWPIVNDPGCLNTRQYWIQGW
ncbi:hypothetical protein HY357_04050, partial [Candidatus Roizmanbacteria bacterium]|nr:hypothetical protein [Candidatus Roizmanbacteria bacterium]